MESKAIIYLRVSSGDQSNSLDVQKSRLEEYCRFKGLEIIEVIIDEDISGHKPFYERPGGGRAKQLFYEGVKTIVVLKVDRIFRNVKDSLITIDEWGDKDISLHITDLGGNSLDVKTAMGRMFFIQAVSMGELERNMAGERTKSVLSHKKVNKNIYCGNIYGYDKVNQQWNGKKMTGGELQPNLKELEIVKQIYEMKSGGFNDNQIATTLNRMNVTTKKGKLWQGSTVASILGNQIYLSLNK
jgi:site-specific DNA recombinase